MQVPGSIFGVDVAKAELLVAQMQGADLQVPVQSVGNDADGISRWLSGLPKGSIVAMESSGSYHELLAQMAHAAGMRVYVLNAHAVYMYARAISARAKTDKLDAAVIARYVREHHKHLFAWKPCSGIAERLQRMLDRRVCLTHQLVRLRLSLKDVPELQEVLQPLQQAYEQALDQLDGKLQEMLRTEPQLEQASKRLETIVGFGAQASIRLASLFTRIDFANADAVVAYSGLDPRPNDSGTKRGRRRLSKRGPATLRRQLYLAALSACNSKAYAAVYKQLRLRFTSTEALVILARKLLRVAWSLWKTGGVFDPMRIEGSTACVKA